jgi:hypothetical protein
LQSDGKFFYIRVIRLKKILVCNAVSVHLPTIYDDRMLMQPATMPCANWENGEWSTSRTYVFHWLQQWCFVR